MGLIAWLIVSGNVEIGNSRNLRERSHLGRC
jgi:hypothetical protein